MYNEDTFKPASPRSAADVEQEDAAMEESEEEPAQESNPLVTSLAARPEDSDSDTCSAHPSQFEEANSGIAEDAWTLTARFALTNVSFLMTTLSAHFILLMTTHFAHFISLMTTHFAHLNSCRLNSSLRQCQAPNIHVPTLWR